VIEIFSGIQLEEKDGKKQGCREKVHGSVGEVVAYLSSSFSLPIPPTKKEKNHIRVRRIFRHPHSN